MISVIMAGAAVNTALALVALLGLGLSVLGHQARISSMPEVMLRTMFASWETMRSLPGADNCIAIPVLCVGDAVLHVVGGGILVS